MPKYLFTLALLIAVVQFQSASASILTFNVGGTEFSQGGPAIASNALVLTFDDGDAALAAGEVFLTVQFNGGLGVDAGAKVKFITFNWDAALPTPTASYESGVLANSTGFAQGGFNSDGTSGWDAKFEFPTGGSAAFQVGESTKYRISAAGLTANSFDFNNGSTAKGGPYSASAHINAYSNGDSGHFGDFSAPPIPEPGSIVIWTVAGLSGLVWLRRRKRA